MLITICDVPEKFREELEGIGGECVRTWGGNMDVQFKSHRMTVRDKYIKLRSNDRKMFVLCDNEFSKIYVQ